MMSARNPPHTDAARPRKRRTRPLKGEDTEVNHVVETQNVSETQARELVRRYGNDWRKIDEAAKSYKSESDREK